MTEQSPYDVAGEPFPTTYYLTCRHLVAAVSRLEAAGGVERWTEAARARSGAAARASMRRPSSSASSGGSSRGGATGSDDGASLELGIGGAARPERLKCLHAHVAFALAQPGYLLGERIARRARAALAGALLLCAAWRG